MFARVLIGYERGVRLPAHGAKRPRFGQLYSDWVRSMAVLHLWPLDFPMNTRASTNVRPLTLWRPMFSGVMHSEMAYSGLERVLIPDGGTCWVAQRWLCGPMYFNEAKKQEAECRAEKWRWID